MTTTFAICLRFCTCQSVSSYAPIRVSVYGVDKKKKKDVKGSQMLYEDHFQVEVDSYLPPATLKGVVCLPVTPLSHEDGRHGGRPCTGTEAKYP